MTRTLATGKAVILGNPPALRSALHIDIPAVRCYDACLPALRSADLCTPSKHRRGNYFDDNFMSYSEQLQLAREQVQIAAEHHKCTQAVADKALEEYKAALLALTELVTLGTREMRPEHPTTA